MISFFQKLYAKGERDSCSAFLPVGSLVAQASACFVRVLSLDGGYKRFCQDCHSVRLCSNASVNDELQGGLAAC